jgi:hypothetical protein
MLRCYVFLLLPPVRTTKLKHVVHIFWVDRWNVNVLLTAAAGPVLHSVACWHLEELETALEAFQAAQHLGPPSSQVSTWISKCQAKLAGDIHRPLCWSIRHNMTAA